MCSDLMQAQNGHRELREQGNLRTPNLEGVDLEAVIGWSGNKPLEYLPYFCTAATAVLVHQPCHRTKHPSVLPTGSSTDVPVLVYPRQTLHACTSNHWSIESVITEPAASFLLNSYLLHIPFRASLGKR